MIKKEIKDTNLQNKKPSEIKTKKEKTSLLKKWGRKWGKLPKKKQTIILGIIGTILIATPASYIYYIFSVTPEHPSKLIKINSSYLESRKISSPKRDFVLKEASEPRTIVSPINGKLLTEKEHEELLKRKPIMVMINNHVAARPQSNLSKADIVYETLVESGITRLFALYWSNGVNKVGPIRSIRQYHLEWLGGYNALLIHDGCASSDDPKVNACGNLYNFNIKDISTNGAWRDNSDGRVAPHNEYSSIISGWEFANNRNWGGYDTDTAEWEFKRDNPTDQRGNSDYIKISFFDRLKNGGLYNVRWDYDVDTNRYYRKQKDLPHKDKETGEQLSAKTVIIQEVDFINTGDSKAHIIIETLGEGDAKILRDGKVIDARWEKDERTDRTIYYDNNDKKIEFNRGLIWICAVSPRVGSFDIIEQ